MKNQIIAFIGGGNMATSLIGGLIADGWDRQSIRVCDPDAARRDALHRRFGITVDTDHEAIVRPANIVVFAVKPQTFQQVAESVSDSLKGCDKLVLSVAAGVRQHDIDRWLGGDQKIVRAMPNTPALVQSGATALFANPRVSQAQKEAAESILRAVGLCLWVKDESLLDAVTALSGSGPAYFFYIMEIMEQVGIKMGLEADSARLLTLQTAFGAAKMALESEESAGKLRQRVTSPGGTTERALSVLIDEKLDQLFEKALTAAQQRAQELADALGNTL